MVVPSAPPHPDRIVVQHVPPTRSAVDDSPPTYEDSANPNSMPPTYESLYGEFRQVEDPKGLAQFLAKAFAVIISTMTAAVLLALLNIIPLGMIVLGSNNLYSCPAEPYIPIWLIVTGFFSLLKSATNFYYRARRQREGRPPSAADVNPNPFDGLLSCFLLVWFIIGSVWVYSVMYCWRARYAASVVVVAVFAVVLKDVSMVPYKYYYCDGKYVHDRGWTSDASLTDFGFGSCI
uniref:MARVEL domain-containing protein n=1 Tax=Setaria digitata TaxID=48799 RepID=A0A915PUP9_9BILA